MQTIPLAKLQEMFASLRAQTAAIDGEMLWSYYFTAPTPEALQPMATQLAERGCTISGMFKAKEEEVYVLQSRRVETHTPESLFALNGEFEALAGQFEGIQYDGMDVNHAHGGGCCGGGGGGCGCHGEAEAEEEHECCGGGGGGCGCHDEAEAEEEHECCGGGGDDCACRGEAEKAEAGHGCCGGHHHHDEADKADKADEDECCGGGHGEGCCGRHVHKEGEAIENPQILSAIQRIGQDRSPDAQQELTMALQRGLYLVPVFSGAQESEDEAVQVLVCSDEKGDEYLPLFTDEPQLKGWTQEKVQAMVLTAPEAWDFILSQAQCSGGVINPGGESLPLSREMVGLLKKMIDDHEQAAATV